MLASTFQTKLKKLNKKLHIFCGDSEYTPAGLWMIDKGEYTEICGVDKQWVNEWPTYDQYGKMVKGGWHRVLKLLVRHKLVDRRQSYKIFGHWDEHREPYHKFNKRPIDDSLNQLDTSVKHYRTIESPLDGSRVEVPVYQKDDVYDIGKMIAKESSARSVPPSTGNRP